MSRVSHRQTAPIMPAVVYRIETPRLVLRCWEPSDAPALAQAIMKSLEHLRPWLPWAHTEPESAEAKIQKIRQWRSKFDRGEDYLFGIFDRESSDCLGATGFHSRIGAGAREIGYWIRADCAGQGLMTEAAGALTRVGFEHDGLHRIEIQCDPTNLASAAIARKLGFHEALVIPKRVHDPKIPPRDTAIWVMRKAEFAGSPAARSQVLAIFDAAGQRLDDRTFTMN
jgi:RimJ/RimL family protein N-acetyltransferase